MTLTHAQNDRLADVRQRARELRERRTRAREFHQQAREAAANYSGDDIQHSDEFMRLQRASGNLDQIDQSPEPVDAEEKWVLSQMAGLDGADYTGRNDSFLHDPACLKSCASSPARRHRSAT